MFKGLPEVLVIDFLGEVYCVLVRRWYDDNIDKVGEAELDNQIW